MLSKQLSKLNSKILMGAGSRTKELAVVLQKTTSNSKATPQKQFQIILTFIRAILKGILIFSRKILRVDNIGHYRLRVRDVRNKPELLGDWRPLLSSGVFFVVPSSVNPAVDGRDLGVLCGDLEVVKVFRGNLDEGEEAVDEGVECEPGVRLEGLRLVADGEVDVEVGLCCDLFDFKFCDYCMLMAQ